MQSLSGCKVTPGLYIVATPIGHLADISLRALAILSQVDVVVCEDTRVTGRLLMHYGVKTTLIAHHKHNETESTEKILLALQSGKSVALVSDAGTPLISDPGAVLIQKAVALGIEVTSIPGACAAIVGLSVSGLPTESFTFVGFLPPKLSARQMVLLRYKQHEETLIFYEAPHRLLSTLTDMLRVLGLRKCVVARELTKKFESVFRGTTEAAVAFFTEEAPKGEFVVMVEGAQTTDKEELTDAVILEVLTRCSSKDAAAELATMYGVPKKDVYQRIVALKENPQ